MNWSDDDLEDREFPDEDDADDEVSETRPCPSCGADVYEDAVACPICGSYVSFSNSTWSHLSWWWTGLGLAGLAAALWTLIFGL